MQTISAYSPFTYNRPNINININFGSPSMMTPAGGWQGPSFQNQGYDQMFRPMGGSGFNSNSMMMNMMSMMMNMMSRMMGGMPNQGSMMPPFPQMPGYGSQQSHLSNPSDFWSTSNGNGYQNHVRGGSDSHINGGHYSSNIQNTHGGHAVQTMNSGYGSENTQNHRWGTSQQSLTTGARSVNNQLGGWNGQQNVRSGYGSTNIQTASGSSSQAAITGSGTFTRQTGTFGPGSVQALKSGNNSRNEQINGADQFTRTANGSSTMQFQGQRQEVVAGKDNKVVQISDASNQATQIATVGENGAVTQAGGLNQEVNLTGPDGRVKQDVHGGARSVVNVDESKGSTMVFNTNGTTGNVSEINYGDESQSRVTTLNSGMAGNATVRRLGGGNDTQELQFNDPKNTGDVLLYGEEGDDTFKFNQMPEDPNATYAVHGGTGNNTLQMPGTNFTLMNPDGSVQRQFGEGGPAITATGLSTLQYPGADGEMVNVNLNEKKPVRRGRNRRR